MKPQNEQQKQKNIYPHLINLLCSEYFSQI